MDGRKKALDELKRCIKEQKARINPKLLKLAEQAAFSGRADKMNDAVPYDRDTATKAVEIFLETHRDRTGFERRLAAFILKNHH